MISRCCGNTPRANPKPPSRRWWRAASISFIRRRCGRCATRIWPRKLPRPYSLSSRKRREKFPTKPSWRAGCLKRRALPPSPKSAPPPGTRASKRSGTCKLNLKPCGLTRCGNRCRLCSMTLWRHWAKRTGRRCCCGSLKTKAWRKWAIIWARAKTPRANAWRAHWRSCIAISTNAA